MPDTTLPNFTQGTRSVSGKSQIPAEGSNAVFSQPLHGSLAEVLPNWEMQLETEAMTSGSRKLPSGGKGK